MLDFIIKLDYTPGIKNEIDLNISPFKSNGIKQKLELSEI